MLPEVLESLGASPQTIALAQGILLGDKSQLSPEMVQSFRTAGMSHLLAVSGLHVGIIMSVIWMLFKPVQCLILSLTLVPRFGIQTGSIRVYFVLGCLLRLLVITVTCLYVYSIGAPPSAVRATLMLSLCLVGWMLQRPTSADRIILFAALLLLAWDPWLLADVGFQLSFLSVGGIIFFQPWINDYEKPWYYRIFLLSLAAQVFTLPVVAFYFHQIPFLGWLQGLLVVPLMPVFVTLLLCILCLPSLTWLLIPIEVIRAWMEYVADLIGTLEQFILGGHLYFYPTWWESVLVEVILLSVAIIIRSCKSSVTSSSRYYI